MTAILRTGIVTALILGSSATLAADQAKLTPQEIAEGWILLFDGQSTFGWKTTGEVSAQKGLLVLAGRGASIESTSRFLEGTLEINYQLVKAECRFTFHTTAQVVGGEPGASPPGAFLRIECGRGEGGQGKCKVSKGAGLPINLTEEKASISDFKPAPVKIACETENGLIVTRIRFKPGGMKPIFNGKDLSGWHVLPGYKSVFSVTPEGWLHLQNGKGDLQTEATWADFILQLECKTNGDRLNSGVFLRCQPKEYQQGYEAQIHNGFGAPKDYTIDHYDPKTHQKMRSEKIKNTSLDFGTGAIYRRQPARFQAAKDRDWFGMTVLAEGNHFATWVNGIQMCDWDDNRPPSDNGRGGYRAEAGHISLQGHDPTTDIDFRNLRIESLDVKSK